MMSLARYAAVPAALITVFAAPLNATAAKRPPTVFGTVGPGYTITLKTAAGKPVRTLPAGLVVFHIADRSTDHDFHLVGPGVDRSTDVPQRGSYVWRVMLSKGVYNYMCDPHQIIMHGRFRVVS
jgi:plastocyanin